MREIKVFLCFDTTDEQEKALAFRHNFDEHVTNGTCSPATCTCTDSRTKRSC